MCSTASYRNDAPDRDATEPDTLIISDAPREMKWVGRAISSMCRPGAAENDDHQVFEMYTEIKGVVIFRTIDDDLNIS